MRLLFLLVIVLIASCAPMPIRAVYLTRGRGQLSLDDLQKHPEVMVTSSFDEFRQHAGKPVALWIDKNAVGLIRAQEPLEGSRWLDQSPQSDYPIVLVGNSDWLYSTRDVLGLCCISGPMVDWSAQVVGPGFTVNRRVNTDTSMPQFTFTQGYRRTPKVQDILAITNALLDGQSVPALPVESKAATPAAQPTDNWTVYRDDALGFQIEYPSAWQVDAEDAWVLFYDLSAQQAFNVATAPWIRRLPNDFIEHLSGTVAMTQTLMVNNRPAVLAQFEPASALGEYKSQVGIITPDGRGLLIGNKTEAEIFSRALKSIQFFKPVNPP